MRLIPWERFYKTHQIADRLRVECIVLNCFFGGTKKKRGYPYAACDTLLVHRSKTRPIKYRVHPYRGPYDLIASSANASVVDYFWAVAAQFYFDGAGLGCGVVNITDDLRPFYSHLLAK